ncbi:MAG: ABC transporter ATP-binding protein [Candidatus Binatia bacterium]
MSCRRRPLYPELTARENLRFFGRMYGVAPASLRPRAEALLELAGLQGRADDRVGTYSGGMKRRLNLAVGLIHEPRLILLDEPTVGVDPQSRERLFALVEHLRARGVAVLYTTHYMEEAERLCDRLAIMDGGRVVATGTLRALLAEAGCAEMVQLHGVQAAEDLEALRAAPGVVRLEANAAGVTLFVRDATRVLGFLQHFLASRPAARLTIAPASLETLFLQLTGKELRDR